jgi:hypothetical protein
MFIIKRRILTMKILDCKTRLNRLSLTLFKSLIITMSWITAVKYPIPATVFIMMNLVTRSLMLIMLLARTGQVLLSSEVEAAREVAAPVTLPMAASEVASEMPASVPATAAASVPASGTLAWPKLY